MPSVSMTYVVIALVSWALLCNQLAAANLFRSNVGDLTALCKNESVTLKTVSDLMKLVDKAKIPNPSCSENTLEALKEMGRIAEDQKACSMDKANDITNFVDKYLKKEDAESERLPKSLVKFAIAYGMRVSIICKRNMIFTFVPTAARKLKHRFGDKSYYEFKDYILNLSPISMILSPVLKAGDVILPSDFMEAVPGYDSKMKQYISDSDALKRLQKFCEKSLQPLYEPILLPIAKLSRAGFNYRDFLYSFDEKMDKLYYDVLTKQSRFWSSIVFMCESAKSIQTVNKGESKMKDAKSIQAVNEDESEMKDQQIIEEELSALAMQLDQRTGVELDQEDIPDDKLNKPIATYVPNEIVSDKIVGTFDLSLKSLVKSYDANKSEKERIQETIKKRSFQIFKMMFKKGHNKPVIKRFFTRLLQRKTSNKEYETAVKGMLEMMEMNADGGSVEYGFAKLFESVIGMPWALIWLITAAPQILVQFGRGRLDYLYA